MNARAIHFHRLGVEIDGELPGADPRLRMPLGAAADRMDTGDQLLAVKRLGDIIVSAQAHRADLAVKFCLAGEDEDVCPALGETQLLPQLLAMDVRRLQLAKDD